jgi:hypothetical protein
MQRFVKRERVYMMCNIYLPESATMSLAERPTFLNFCTRVATPDVGAGRLVLAPCRLAVRLSFRPTSTSQLGPPD